MSKASQLLVVTDTWDEAGCTGPVTFGEETDSSAGACRALDRSPPPRARAAPRALPPAHCQTTSKQEHMRCAQHQVVCCRYPHGVINTEQEEYTWVGWTLSNSVFAFFFYDLIAATLLLVFHNQRHQASLWSPTLISNRWCTKVTLNTYSGLKPNLENWNMVVCMHLCMLNKSTSRLKYALLWRVEENAFKQFSSLTLLACL